MVKIRTALTVPWIDSYFAGVQHFGGLSRYDPTAWHMVYGYQMLDGPIGGVNAYHVHDTLDQALLEARSWVGMPELVADICDYCRYPRNGPHLPRWNIYRGRESKAPPCILWSFWWGPPPWPPV